MKAPKAMTYRIREEGQTKTRRLEVRDTLIHRVLKYVKHGDFTGYWLDKGCINQKNGKQKAVAIQSMDLIYRFGSSSVAFLTTPIKNTYQAKLLSKLMSGKWLCQQECIGRIKLKRYVRVWQAADMIAMIEHILSDRWWTRAWTYHEEFCASTNMVLAMPHEPGVDKLQRYDFKDIPGEIQILAVRFREQLSRFCLAHGRKQGERWQRGKRQCEKLLTIAGQHRTVNQHRKQNNAEYGTGSLTWQVISDLCKRQLNSPWEILAIIANYCGYLLRLNIRLLKKRKCALGAAVLVLNLLNGEILCNGESEVLGTTASFFDLTNHLSFRNFSSMVDAKEYT